MLFRRSSLRCLLYSRFARHISNQMVPKALVSTVQQQQQDQNRKAFFMPEPFDENAQLVKIIL